MTFDTVVVDYVKDENIMRELYVAADIFVVPSMADTSPLTVMEAMASGTPVVAFKTGGIPEIISEETGWLAEQGNSKALAEKIEQAFQNKEELNKKGIKCRGHIEKNYSEEAMIKEYRNLYIEILQKNNVKNNL